MKKKNGEKKPNIVITFLKEYAWQLLVGTGLLIVAICLICIVNWYIDNRTITKILFDLDNEVIYEEVVAPPESENVEIEIPIPEEVVEEPKWNDYLDYINLPLISVDFTNLKEKNKDTVAFLKVPGTSVNYPVVQTKNNDYYLTHAFDKSYNAAGWVFMDYRNNIDDLSDNTIIYGHGRLSKTMFGSLKNVLKDNWLNNKDNHVIYLSSEKENTLWQVFSVYTIPTETYYLISKFGSEESHQKYIDTIKSRSIYDFNTEVTTSNKILTLSTCYNDDLKLVLHAILIKTQVR